MDLEFLALVIILFLLIMRTRYLLGLQKKGYGSPIFRRTFFSEPYGMVNKKQAKGYEKQLLSFEILFQIGLILFIGYKLLFYLRDVESIIVGWIS